MWKIGSSKVKDLDPDHTNICKSLPLTSSLTSLVPGHLGNGLATVKLLQILNEIMCKGFSPEISVNVSDQVPYPAEFSLSS